MNSVFLASSSSSMKCSPRPISSISSGVGGSSVGGPRAQSSSETNSKMSLEKYLQSDDEYEYNVSSKSDDESVFQRNPLTILQENQLQNQLLLTTQNNELDASEATPPAGKTVVYKKFFNESDGTSAETTPAATNSLKSTNVFQYSRDHLAIDNNEHVATTTPTAHALATKTLSTSSSDSSRNSIVTTVHANVSETTHTSCSTTQQQPLQRRISSSGVVRRRSWRTHYTRPNKSLEYESGQTKVVSHFLIFYYFKD